MLEIRKVIFERYFSRRTNVKDPNKDVNGKGTLQRFVEMLAGYLDTDVLPMARGMVKRVVDPYTMDAKYLDFMMSYYGYDEKNRTLYMGDSEAIKRALVKIMPKLLTIRGTKRALDLLFGMLGMTVTIEERSWDFGFDSPTTFDSDYRSFDSFEKDYTYFAITVTGPLTMTDELLEIIRSIIIFNAPINGMWYSLIYNGEVIVGVLADFNLDYNRDYAT